MLVVLRKRFLSAYALLALVLAGSGAATWGLASRHRPAPLAPGAVALVTEFLEAVQQNDLRTACRLFSALPTCDPAISTAPLERYQVFAAELAVGGYDVPATLNGEPALFSIAERRGRYRIVDIVADPAAFDPAALGLAST